MGPYLSPISATHITIADHPCSIFDAIIEYSKTFSASGSYGPSDSPRYSARQASHSFVELLSRLDKATESAKSALFQTTKASRDRIKKEMELQEEDLQDVESETN